MPNVIELDNDVLHRAVLDDLLDPGCLVHFVLPKHLLRLLHLLFFLLSYIEVCLVLLYSAALYLLIWLRSLAWWEAVEKLNR